MKDQIKKRLRILRDLINLELKIIALLQNSGIDLEESFMSEMLQINKVISPGINDLRHGKGKYRGR